MYVAQAREKVCISGRSGAFLVLWVDHEQQVVDLFPLDIPLDRAEYLEETVHFSQLEPYRESMALKSQSSPNWISTPMGRRRGYLWVG